MTSLGMHNIALPLKCIGLFISHLKGLLFRNGGKLYGNFLGSFPNNPEIIEFSQSAPFNQKYRKENQI